MIRHYLASFQNQGKLWYSADQFATHYILCLIFCVVFHFIFFLVRNFLFSLRYHGGVNFCIQSLPVSHSKMSLQSSCSNASCSVQSKRVNDTRAHTHALSTNRHFLGSIVFRHQCLHSSSWCNAVTAGGCAAVSVDWIIFKQHTCYW